MKVFIKNKQSPGDVIMLTAAVRDLKLAHPEIEIGVKTTAMQLWENNPHIDSSMTEKDADKVIDSEYSLINKSNQLPYHFIHGFRMDLEKKLGLSIPVTAFHGDIHLSNDEKNWISQAEEVGHKNSFWIIMAGGKFDFTAKWWNPRKYQEVVNKLKREVKFIQCGSSDHWHPKLDNVIDMIGKTDIRQFVRLMYHAQGVICPVTFAMHLAAAVPTKEGMPKNRSCVVIAGGREPAQWEAYPHHRYLSTNGTMMCCDNGGCWKSRCQSVGDKDKKDDIENRCVNPVHISSELSIPKCMELIGVVDVVRAVKKYFDGGALEPYTIGGGMNRKQIRSSGEVHIKAEKDIVVFGVKRSGNHMLLDWIINQHEGQNFFLNDLSHGRIKQTLYNEMKSNRLPSHKNIISGSEVDVIGGVNLFLQSYEDILPCNRYHKSVSSKDKYELIILRDFRNWVCSLNKMLTERDWKKSIDKYIPMWGKHAELFLSGDKRLVLYDRFVSDASYRDEIANMIGVDSRSDDSLNHVSSYGWGSSFDGNSEDGSATTMNVLYRYKECEEELWYKEIVKKHPNLIEMNLKIFGDHNG